MKKNNTFEFAMTRLEEITALLSAGNLSLEESLKLFTESSELIVFCDKQLVSAKKKIDNLYEDKKEGQTDECV